MGVWRLIAKEIGHRRLNFVLAVLSVLVASATLVAALTLLHAHELRNVRELARFQDETRKTMKKLGFNVLIFPKDQNRWDLYAQDFGARTMPESYVKRLAESRIMTVNHLLPILQQKVKWQGRTVILVGTRGEIPLMHRDPKKPILAAVEPGTMVLGYELHQGMKLKAGDRATLLGREFTVGKCHAERGSKDDITIWIDLAEAQELLAKKGQINAIMALSCKCEGERLAGIRAEIASILPETQVIEFSSQSITRAEARADAARHAETSLVAQETFAAFLVPMVLIGCAGAVAALAFQNARDRRSEIGILRALGMPVRNVLVIFLGKAVLTGLIGASLGYLLGFVVGAIFGDAVFKPNLLVLVILLSPLLAALATWLPALIASQQDPALVLREE